MAIQTKNVPVEVTDIAVLLDVLRSCVKHRELVNEELGLVFPDVGTDCLIKLRDSLEAAWNQVQKQWEKELNKVKERQ